MRKILLAMGCFLFFLSSSIIVNGQLLSPHASVEGELTLDTMAFFVGKTRLIGTFSGYKIDYLLNETSFSGIDAVPILGSCTFKDIDSVTVFDINTLNNKSFEDILDLNLDEFSVFTHVNIMVEKGPSLLGINQSNLVVDSNLEFAISSVMNLKNEEGNSTPFLAIISSSSMKIQYLEKSFFLTQTTENGTIIIEDLNGNVLWNENSTQKIFLIEDRDLSFTQNSPLYIFPIIENDENIALTISPADLQSIDIMSMINEVSTVTSDFGEIPDISESMGGFNDIIPIISSVVNGGIIISKTNDIFTIDNSPQKFTGFGFARGDNYQVNIHPKVNKTEINGDSKLVFLGNHFYTSQAKESDNGVSFPYAILLVWIIAISLFLLMKYYFKKEIKINYDKRIKKFLLIFHIIALIIAFILMDQEINYQFGTSFLNVLFGQGFSLVAAIFIVIELIMWVLGYILLAIPMYILSLSILKIYGIGDGSKSISKGFGAFFIWIFCAFYIKLILNLFFSILNPGNLFMMG